MHNTPPGRGVPAVQVSGNAPNAMLWDGVCFVEKCGSYIDIR